MATDRRTIYRWTRAQIKQLRKPQFDSERDLFPLFEAIGTAWLFDSDDLKLVHRAPNPRQLWRENLSAVIQSLVKEGLITPTGNRGGSVYVIN